MIAISFKSESCDDYLEMTESSDYISFINDIVKKHGEEWYYMHVIIIKSSENNEDEINDYIHSTREGKGIY